MKPASGRLRPRAFNARPMGCSCRRTGSGWAGSRCWGCSIPGFWLIGAGLETGLSVLLATNPRFQRVVDRLATSIASSSGSGRRSHAACSALAGRSEALPHLECAASRSSSSSAGRGCPPDLQSQAEGLGRLLWIYLRLLVTRQGIERLLRESSAERRPSACRWNERISQLEEQLKAGIARRGTAQEPRRAVRDPPAAIAEPEGGAGQARFSGGGTDAHPGAGRADPRAGGPQRPIRQSCRSGSTRSPRRWAGRSSGFASSSRSTDAWRTCWPSRRRCRRCDDADETGPVCAGGCNESANCPAGRRRCAISSRAGRSSQFILHGNMFDVVPDRRSGTRPARCRSRRFSTR